MDMMDVAVRVQHASLCVGGADLREAVVDRASVDVMAPPLRPALATLESTVCNNSSGSSSFEWM